MAPREPYNSIDKLYLQKYYQRAARVRRFTTTLRYVEMKHIVRLGVLSALVLATSLPACAQYSNSDMGFEPTARDVGYQGLVTRGYGGNNSTQGGAYAGADDGDQSHRAERNSDRTWFDGQNRETQQYLINLPYRQSSQAQSQTKQQDFQRLTNGVLTGTGLLSTNSVGRAQFRGPQTLGFRGTGAPTIYALQHRFFTPATGTGSVGASITSANGKD